MRIKSRPYVLSSSSRARKRNLSSLKTDSNGRRRRNELASHSPEFPPCSDCVSRAAGYRRSSRILARTLARPLEVSGGSSGCTAAGSATHSARLLHARSSWSKESAWPVCRVRALHAAHVFLSWIGNSISPLQPAVCGSTHGKCIRLGGSQASRRGSGARRIAVAQVPNNHVASGKSRGTHRSSTELRAYHRRIWGGADGRRQHSRCDTDDLDCDLR